MERRDEEILYKLFFATEGRTLIRAMVKRLHRAQKAIEEADTLEDVRRAQGRIEELKYFIKLRKRLREKL